MKAFEFELGQFVFIVRGKTGVGKVTGRAEYLDSNPQYCVAYTSADGNAACMWFYGSELSSKYEEK